MRTYQQGLLLLLFWLSVSCTKPIYHVASVQSEQVKFIDKDFAFENDHLRGAYNLWEEGGRMRFLLFNKTDKPLYIDWSKSFLIRNGNKTFYSQLSSLTKKAVADTVRYVYQHTYLEPYRITARANRLTEIPAQTYVAIADFPIQQTVLYGRTPKKLFTYTQENSPLRVGQQLTYSFDQALTNAHSTTHLFWVDTIRVMRTGELYKLYGSLKKGQPNAFYAVEKRPAPGQSVVLGVVIAAGTVGGILLLLDNLFNDFTPW